jgi:DNA-binding transcriptional regulator GbsR (MarR family)
MSDPLEIIPKQNEKGKRFFQTEEEYQEFRRTFFEEVKEDLERFQEARQQSEEEAKQHWMR